MLFDLNFKSGVPVYLQIVEQVGDALATGALSPGDQLPSIRALAEQLRLNRNTVAKAYTELERAGLVHTEPGRGVFCSAGAPRLGARARREELARAIDAVIVQAYHLRVDAETLRAILEQRLAAFEDRLRQAAEIEQEDER